MKSNITVNISVEEIKGVLYEAIEDMCQVKIECMVDEKGNELVEKALGDKIEPIVENYFKNAVIKEKGDYSYDYYNRNADDFILRKLKEYMDEPCYEYSRDSKRLSDKYRKSDHGDMTRAERWIKDCIKDYMDNEFAPKVNEKVTKILDTYFPTNQKIKELIKEEINKKLEI